MLTHTMSSADSASARRTSCVPAVRTSPSTTRRHTVTAAASVSRDRSAPAHPTTARYGTTTTARSAASSGGASSITNVLTRSSVPQAIELLHVDALERLVDAVDE